MMSLFSNFDIYFFPLSKFIILIFFLNIFSKIFKVTLASKGFVFLFKTFEEFFLSLKIKSFNKSFIVFFTSMVIFFLLLNFSSVLSFIFPLSSQASIVLFFGLSSWMTFMIFTNVNSWKGFLAHCVPEGTPLYLIWFLFLIELISNSIRPLTVSIRLVANILAGHLLMILLSKLVFSFSSCMIFYLVLNSVEFFVAMIQAYIFSTMMALYYSDVN